MTTSSSATSCYLVVRVGERSNGGIRDQSPQEVSAAAPPGWVPYFVVVESADAAVAKTGDLGGATIFGPMEMPNGGRIAALRDPQGAVFSVWEGELED